MTRVSATPSPVWPLSAAAAAALTVANVQAMTTAQASTLTAANLNTMSASALQALSAVQIKAVAAAALAGLSQPQAARLTTTELAALTASETGAFTTAEIAALSTQQVGALNAAGLSAAQVAALSSAQTQALKAAQIGALSAAALSGLKAGQLTSTQAAGLSTAVVAGLAAGQVAALSTAALAALSAGDLAALTTAATAALTSSQAAALTATQLGGLSSASVAAMTTGTLAALGSVQARALSASDLDALGAAQMQALKLSALSAATLRGLTAAAIAKMSASEFAAVASTNVATLTTAQVKGITAAEIGALSSAQIGAVTTAQQSALSTSAAAALVNAQIVAQGGGAVLSDFQSQETNGSIGYSGLLKVLQDAATGGITKGEFSALTLIANELNAAGGVTTSEYDQQIFDDVVKGNSANAAWTGGQAKSVALGNLSATSSQTQAQELVGKWFLGTDLPSFGYEVQNPNQAGYETVQASLFSGSGPTLNDINQGAVGDCFFMAALGTEVEQNPNLIKNMIKDNGNGSYSVLFHVNGKDDYVTVNNQLVVNRDASVFNPDGSKLMFDSSANDGDIWSALVEKAYAQLMSQTEATTYAGHGHVDSYAAIEGGDENGLTAITGQSVTDVRLTKTTSATSAQSALSALQAALNAGQGVMLGTDPGQNSLNYDFIPGHMFTVTGVDTAKGTVTLFNPWGTSIDKFGGQSTITVSLATMEKQGVDLFYATGARAAA